MLKYNEDESYCSIAKKIGIFSQMVKIFCAGEITAEVRKIYERESVSHFV